MKRLSGRAIAVGVFMLLLIRPAVAEYRLWTDKEGKTIEGELVKVVGSTVIIQPREGDELRIRTTSLSETDLEYIELATPPRMEITVSKVKEDEDYRARFRRVEEETVQVSVNIRKSSSRPYSGKLMAILIVIAKNTHTDDYMVAGRIMSPFTFTSENKNVHEFSSDEIRLAHSEAGGDFGGEYGGYLVAVIGPDRKMISAKGSRKLFEQIAEDLVKSKKGAIFDKNGKIVERSRGEEKVSSRKQEKRQKLLGR